MNHILFPLLGLGNGAVFAALSLALVMTYRSSGVVNFATGAVALYSAYTYSFLRKGDLFIPFPGLPTSIALGTELPFALAFPVALVAAALLGALLHVAVFRPLRTAPAVAKAVASIAVMVVIQGALAQRLGTAPVRVAPIFPRSTYTWGHLRVPGDRLWFAATICAVAVALSVLLRFTRFGLAMRAVAQSEKGAIVTGLSPDRIALGSAALSASVAGLGGILIAPIVPLVPISYTLFIVPALAAALVGGMTRLTPAVLAALIIGMSQSELAYLQIQHPSWPQSGLAELVPLGLIFVVLSIRGRPLPQRGALIVRALGHAPRPQRIGPAVLIGSAVGAVLITTMSDSYRVALITAAIMGVIALSLVVVTGFAGQISLAQLALAGVGGFTVSKLSFEWALPFPIAPLLAAGIATAVGVVVGLPALRIRGLPVAIVTLALAVGLHAFWFSNPSFTGGVQGARVEPPRLLGFDLSIGSGPGYPRAAFGLLCLTVLVVAGAGVALLRCSTLGAAMLAVRANERAAAAVGINVARTKLLAFAIGAFIAGMGGALLAYQQTLATPESYGAMAGLGLFASVYLAGITSTTGGVIAGIIASGGILSLIVNKNVSLGGWYEVITGTALVFTVIRHPEGIAGVVQQTAERVRHRRPASTSEHLTRHAPSSIRCVPANGPIVPSNDPDAESNGAAALAVRSLTVRFGGVTAIDAISFDVPTGRIVGLIGPNGAGKTTTLDAIMGFTDASGSVELAGRRIDRLRPHRRAAAGLGRSFQALELWEDLTVAENIAVGRHRTRDNRGDDRPLGVGVGELGDLLGLEPFMDRKPAELSQGQRQLVSIARAMASRPSLLLLDEPAGGLDSSESAWLADRLLAIKQTGTTILMIEHDMSLVMGMCELVHVLDFGELIATGTPAQIRAHDQVRAAYLGASYPLDTVGR